MGELVSKADDLRCLIDLGKQVAISPRELAKCLADDGELPLDRDFVSALVRLSVVVPA